VEFRILGPLEVVDAGRAVPLGGSRQRTLLALLLMRPNEVVSADRLIDGLWGERPPASAANALQYHVSQLRKALLPADVLATRGSGYTIEVGPDDLDVFRFERLVAEAEGTPPERAALLLREALGLWRGQPLADLAAASFAAPDIHRLDELRLGALERRLEADLELDSHVDVVPELEALVREHPLRERLRALLMRALYGAGRQADALEVYRETRALLVDELGIEPSPALQELQQAILVQDPGLQPKRVVADAARASRAIVVVCDADERIDDLLAIAEPLARPAGRELILVRLVGDRVGLAEATASLAEHRQSLRERGIPARVAVYTADDHGGEAALLATENDVDLVLADGGEQLADTGLIDRELATLLADAPCDVAILAGGGRLVAGPIVTPFGGVEHDWSAIEIAAWLATSLGRTLRLVGTEADAARGRRDASRLLARASLLVQQMIGVVAEPVLAPAGGEGFLGAAHDAAVVVVGLSERWRSEGLGEARRAIAAGAARPTLFVRRGVRPSGVAPGETMTRFTWTLGSIEPAEQPVAE
jgi:DNA-binding SARP family transcriptional activator